MANVHDWSAAPPLAGVTRPHAAAPRKAPDADERLGAQRKVQSRVLFGLAVALFLSGFFASALWVIAAFAAFGAYVSRGADPSYCHNRFSDFDPLETAASREFEPGTAEWNIRMMRDHGG
ncbi:hypothetical protein FAZ78_00775 [Cereibacter changlensis]|uniref:Uncharacterized protein n=1 Tax=Cereibacter changlensis TaxID=402884 RepID=A0A4V5NPX5_9RHOB|nr:hypothetical protein [Cereibacter changlensis]TKA98387.1 hypothetical protein FAZ78_00775 [Cereibacter changlensis]